MSLIGKMKFADQTQSSLLCLWRNRAALRRALASLGSLAISFHWRSQVVADQFQDALVSYLSADFRHQ